MSLLLDHGHPLAQQYPIGMVWVETDLVNSRVNNEKADQAILTQKAVSSLFSKEDSKSFTAVLKALRDER